MILEIEKEEAKYTNDTIVHIAMLYEELEKQKNKLNE